MSTISWRSAQSGRWAFGSYWDYGVAPIAADAALFDIAGAYVVTIDTSAVAQSLVFDAAGASLQETTGSLTMTGNLAVDAGEVALDGANSFGLVDIDDGVLSISSSGALGVASVLMFGGELAAAATATVSNSLTMTGADIISASSGATLTLTGGVVLEGADTLIIGSAGATGAVLWQAANFTLASEASANLDVRGGTLTFGNFSMGLTYAGATWTSIDVESGATLDFGGSPTTVKTLSGSGTLMNSVYGENITVGGGAFGGTIEDDISLTLTGNFTLSGVSNLSGIEIAPSDALINAAGGVIHFDTNALITPSSTGQAYFSNKGSFLRGGLAGNTSVASVLFINSGFMANTGGSINFTGGFSNMGVVEGVLTTTPDGSVTWTADAPGAPLTFVGAGDDDIFSLSAAPGHVDGGGGTNTVDALASMTFAAGSLANVQRIVVADGATVNLSAVSTNETVILASLPGGGAAAIGGNGLDSFIANSGNDHITFGPVVRDSATLAPTNGAWDTITGSNGSITLNNAQANVIGGDDTMTFGSGAQNVVSLYATKGAWDTVKGAGGEVILNDAQASVVGGGDVIYLNGTAGNDVSLFNTGNIYDSVYGSNAVVNMTQAKATLTGGGDAVHFAAASGESVALAGTNGVWDSVQGAGVGVTLNGAQASLTGGGDVLTFGAGAHNQASLYATGGAWDTVYGDGAVVNLVGAQASLTGRGDVVSFAGGTGDAVSLFGTVGVWDAVYGKNAVVTLTNAQANLMAGGDTVYVNGAGGGSASAFGDADLFVFGAVFGKSWIGGFDATDHLQFAKSDFANFSVLMADASQSGADTLIKLDANDVLTLANVSKSNLVVSEFQFV